jgi:hypothetical protein
MDAARIQLIFSEQINFHIPLQFVNTENSNDATDVNKLIDYQHFFKQTIKNYLPQWPENQHSKIIKTFYEAYQVDRKKGIIKSTQQSLPISSKQAQLLLAIDAAFCYLFDKTHTWKSSSEQISPPLRTIQDNREKTPLSVLEALPAELLMKIFVLSVSNWQSVGRISLCSKKCYRVTSNPAFLKTIFRSHAECLPSILSSRLHHSLLSYSDFHPSEHVAKDLSIEDLKIIADHGSNLKKLSLINCHFPPESFVYLLQHCPQLHTLEFNDCNTHHFDGYMSVVSLYGKGLKHLKVINCQMSDQSLLALSFAPLKLVSFEYENHLSQGLLSDFGLLPFLSSSHLESLKLTGSPQVTQISLATYMNQKDERDQIKGDKLKQLSFSYCGVSGPLLFENIGKFCPNLEMLELGFTPSQCQSDLYQKQDCLINLSQHCSKVRSLKMTHCSYLSSRTIEKMLENFQNLEHLELCKSNPLTDSFFISLTKCEQLKSFKYRPLEPSALSWKHLEKLTYRCPKLQHLALMDCRISEQYLPVLIKNCKMMQIELATCGIKPTL